MLIGNVETLQQNRRIGFGGIAVFFADDAFQFAQLHAILIGHLVLGIDQLAFFQSGPQAPVAHDDGVDHAIVIEGKLVLAQHAELARTDDGSFLRLQFAGQQLHKRGFARAIGPGEAIALPRHKAGGDFVKQNFGAVAHGHIAD